MNDLLMIYIGSILPLAFIGGWLISYLDSRSHRTDWNRVAADAGLAVSNDRLSSNRPILSGSFRGRDVQIRTQWTPYSGGSYGHLTIPTTHIYVDANNPVQAHLRLVKQGIDIGWLRFAGIRDVVIGDAAFDRQFLIKSQPEAFAVALFHRRDMLRYDLRKMPVLWQFVELSGDELTYAQFGIQRDVRKLRFLLNLLCDLAEAVEQESFVAAMQS